jgi:hypothetical protein
MPTPESIDAMNAPPYIFVNGDGSDQHETTINGFALKGYRVISVLHHPGNSAFNKTVVVLMGHGKYAHQ